MPLIVVRDRDYSVIQSPTNTSAVQIPFVFKRGTTPRVGVQFVDETGAAVVLDTYATNVRTFTGQPANGDQDNIAGTAYTWKAALTGAANEILIGANLTASIANYIGALEALTTGGQGAGATYGTGTVANLFLSAASVGALVTVTSLIIGTAGNAYATTMTGASGSWANATLIGGYTASVTLGAKPANANNTVAPGTTAYDGPYAITGTVNGPPDATGTYWVTVSFTNANLNALLGYNPPVVNDDIAFVNLTAAVKTVVGADIEETADFVITVRHDINQGVEAALTNAATVVKGTIALGAGVDHATVTGLALASVPAQILLTLSKATGDNNLEIVVRNDSKSTDGFTLDVFPGVTPSANYKVDYLIFL